MADTIDLSGDPTRAIDGAYNRGHPVALAYVDEQGKPCLSLRGSAQVLNKDQVGVWARKTDEGLAKAIRSNPNVALIFFGEIEGGGKMLLNGHGRAHADPARNDEVYQGMIENERSFDPDAKGVAVIIDVDALSGMSMATGPFSQTR